MVGGARWTPRLLVLTVLLMAWSPGHCLKDRFDEARNVVTAMYPSRRRVGKTYQGFIRSLLTLGLRLLEPVMQQGRNHLQRIAGKHWTREGFIAFAVDGSRLNAPRTQANEQAIGCTKRGKAGPQFWLTTLWHMGTGLPWSWKIGRSTDTERTHLRQMLGGLPDHALLVADAGFTGYELMTEMLADSLSFLIRVGANVRLLEALGYAEVEKDGTVYLWPEKAMRNAQPPLVLRLLVFQRGSKKMYLLTNLDEQALSDRQAAVLYEMRWGVEIFFRSLKQTLARRAMLSRAPRQAKAELAWTMLGLQLLGLLSVEAIIEAGHDPLSGSVAMALRVVRQAMANRSVPGGRRGLRQALARSIKDTYIRTSNKRSRDWPHKKTQSPPGHPKIRKAKESEIKCAKAIKQTNIAA